MNYAHCAAKGANRQTASPRLAFRSLQRAAVNIYKTDTSYEMLVFAPGRIREHFGVELKGNELTVSYSPPENFPKFDWVLREYSRGGFVRVFTLDDTIDSAGVTARYEDGVLQVHLPLVPGKETRRQHIAVS